MIKVLPDCPEGATACLAEIAQGLEGVHAILASQAGVVKAVADIVLHPPTGSVAAQEKGAAMVERVARIDEVSDEMADHLSISRPSSGAATGPR